jgi:hypothetical protein
MNYEIHTKGHELDDIQNSLLKTKMTELLEVSPSDANGTSKLIKTENGYLGILKIMSSQGKFIAEATSQNLDNVINSLFQLVYNQLKVWRHRRFETPVLVRGEK